MKMICSGIKNKSAGFSLIEIMVALVIGLLTTLAITQTLAVFEGQKRTTTNGADAQTNGLVAMHMLETDIRMAGYGITNSGSLACTKINTYYNGAVTLDQSMAPVIITDGGTGSDTIDVLFSSSAFGSAPARIVVDMPTPSNVLTVNDASGINTCDFILLATPSTGASCTRMQVTGIHTTANGDNVLTSSGQSLYDPPGGFNGTLFPPGGYTISPQSVVLNMGNFINRRYQVTNNSLRLQDLNQANNGCSPTNPNPTLDLVSNIVNIQAQYGVAPPGVAPANQAVNCWTDATGNACAGTDWANPTAAEIARIKAVRVAIVARSTQMEKPSMANGACDTTTTAPISWNGGPAVDLTADANWQCYRYKVYQTIIPIRNVIWANI
ncbi:MAG: PilW family protein [Thiothrix sp.]|jgi:type IV pilus assembly protein PilW|uniref:PilW family protein n=1 Tax=Thiothrix sp. TaxID=1032 RepID=UPI00262CC158|nr:PilW family protein [Thiothrix sp.]MDD5395526.1 PilW family protein [Thiothrix sp.]